MQNNQLISNLLHLNNLRKFVGSSFVSLTLKSKFKLEILEKPMSGRVLVLAPHPDDEVFGCGGTLALHRKNHNLVKVIYLASTPEREMEATKSCKHLKIIDFEFWRLKEGELSATKTIADRLCKLINNYQPEIIYCPCFTDANTDHFETAKILYQAISRIKQLDNIQPSIFLYEIWTPLFVNRLIKIDSVIVNKKDAMQCFQSQLKDRNYLKAILGLNAYRAGMFNAGNFAEGFVSLKPDLYLKLFQKGTLLF